MDIKNPEYILEIARQQSVTHAAEKLFVTQSTLSQYLLKLENELGTPLFSREKSGLVPTEAGHVYLHAARAVVQIQNAAEVSIAALKKEGFLCVGVSFWGLTLLTGLLPTFWNFYNSLPTPDFKRRAAQETVDAKPARRRIIAQGVYGELPSEASSGDDD